MLAVPLPAGVSRRPGRPVGIGDGRFVEIAPDAGYGAPVTQTAAEWLASVPGRFDGARPPAGVSLAGPASIVHASSRHGGSPPLPQVDAWGNVPLTDGSFLAGGSGTITFEDAVDPLRTQAVLEFHGFAICVVDIAGNADVELWACERGSKVAVQSAPTHVTVLNLDDARSPLLTLTAYDPRRTRVTRTLHDARGPILAARFVPAREAVFRFNPAWINRGDGTGVTVKGTRTAEETSVRIALSAGQEQGAHLWRCLFEEPDVVRAFGRLNVRMLPAPSGVELGPAPGEKADLRDRRHLVPALAPGRPLHQRLYVAL